MFIDFISRCRIHDQKLHYPFFRAYFCELEFKYSFLCVHYSWGASFMESCFNVLAWRRFTYRMEDDEFRVESGVITKKKKYISLERIQTVNTSEGIFQRIFGLVRVQIETAGGTDGT